MMICERHTVKSPYKESWSYTQEVVTSTDYWSTAAIVRQAVQGFSQLSLGMATATWLSGAQCALHFKEQNQRWVTMITVAPDFIHVSLSSSGCGRVFWQQRRHYTHACTTGQCLDGQLSRSHRMPKRWLVSHLEIENVVAVVVGCWAFWKRRLLVSIFIW